MSGRLSSLGRAATSIAILTTLFTVYAPGRAAAATTASAYSTAAYATKGSVSPEATISGSAGALVGPLINPVLAGLVNPLLASVSNLPQNIVAAVASGLVSAGGATASTAVSGNDPWPSFPSCSSSPFTTVGSCYSVANLSMVAAPALSAQLQSASGYTVKNTSGSQAVVGAAGVVMGGLSALGVPIATGGAASARSACPTSGSATPAAATTLSSLTLLGGAVTASSNGSGLAVTVGGHALSGVESLTVSGLPVSVSVAGGLLTIDVSLTPQQLFDGLGVSTSVNLLNSIASSSIHLKVIVGPGSSTTSSNSAQAWGLELGVDLSASITVDAGLATLTATIPSGLSTSGPNLIDLKLAYTTCDGGTSTPPTGAVPPGVN